MSDLSNVPPEYHDLRPGSKNIKPDALSRLHSPDSTEKEAEPIVPSHWTFGALVWEVEDLIDNAQRTGPRAKGPFSSRPKVCQLLDKDQTWTCI
ncbi:hypothetical protein ATANTOWER_030211 [Ataeniobius toweri]|uniref:Uncharacterized protein n=1 Tax=Ataeniobius toweri TaxID=208326 RepID=A0ABU7AL92_9TELE|nr:hypothetical protein [Ataeniobius toweri]